MEKEHEVLFIKGLRRKKLRFGVLPDSSLCQNGKQVEIITKMIFELCYIEATISKECVYFSTLSSSSTSRLKVFSTPMRRVT